MWFLSGILLAISLSMDALGIGISYGLRGIKVPNVPKIIISFISLLFTAIAIGIGNIIVLFLPDYLAKLIGSGMLIVLGIFIIVQAANKNKGNKENKEEDKEKPNKTWSLGIKPLGITVRIIRDKVAYNIEKSDNIGIKEAIYMGVALSIDSFGAGISSAVSGVNNFFVPIMVGLCQFIFLSLGVICGQKLTSFKKIDSNIFMVLSGIILIVLAGIRYFM